MLGKININRTKLLYELVVKPMYYVVAIKPKD